MFLSTGVQAQISILGLLVLQDWATYCFCLYLPESRQNKIFSSGYREGLLWKQISISVNCSDPHHFRQMLFSKGNQNDFQANHCSCQPHKLGDKGRAEKGELFYCPIFQRQFPSQSRWVIHRDQNPTPWIPSWSGGLYPIGKATSLLRNMQRPPGRDGGRQVHASFLSLPKDWRAHTLSFSGH